MATLVEREKKSRVIVDGYTRNSCNVYIMDIPSDIIQIIFIFFYCKIFDFDFSKEHIQIKENTLTNISSSCLNTTVVGDWMMPDSKKIHTMTVKVASLSIQSLIGIASTDYVVNGAFIFSQKAYSYSDFGSVFHDGREMGRNKNWI